ncbi:MAG: phosphate-starvation-inducible PsiE family protein [Nitrospirae bacterium]|nr:phosphate-starvation-inducible PsiE family protein [Nitrospirota bacterium]
MTKIKKEGQEPSLDQQRGQRTAIMAIRRWLLIMDDIVHVIVAIALLGAAIMMILYTITPITPMNLRFIKIQSVLDVINDVLLVLIIMEVLWTVLRYLKRQKFSLNPFLAIGIISSIRRILVIGAQMSIGEMHDLEKVKVLFIELGINTGIILALIVAYYIYNKTPLQE